MEYISKDKTLKKLQMQLLDLEADQDKGEYSELCENRGARDALDEAIKHCLDIADGQDKCAEISVSEHAKERISQCAADHRQLAEWLTELKEAKSIIRVCNRVLGYLLECEIESTSTRHEVETLLKNITVFLSGGGENE